MSRRGAAGSRPAPESRRRPPGRADRLRPPGRADLLRGDAGRVSLFLAVSMAGVLMVVGLAFDGAGQLRTMHRADNLAAEAARTGGQAIDRAQAIDGGRAEIDEVAATAAVRNYLAAAGVADHRVTFPVVDGEKRITVRLSITYDRYLLGLFDLTDSVTVSGEATARAITGP